MNEIPKSADEARKMLAEAERELNDLSNQLGVALVDHAAAEGRGDSKTAGGARSIVLQVQAGLTPAREHVNYLKDIAERLSHAEERIARDRRQARWKGIHPEAGRVRKQLETRREAVINVARQLILESKAFNDARTGTAALRNEFMNLRVEFGGDPDFDWPDLDYWRLPLAPDLPMHEALSGLRGRSRNERTNRAIRPLQRINDLAAKVRKAKK